MFPEQLKEALRFYFITDDNPEAISPLKQTRIALQAGATMVQYRNKAFEPHHYQEVEAIRTLCRCNDVPFIVNDDIVLAKAVEADGVHVGQADDSPMQARILLGDQAIIGVSVSNMDELRNTDLTPCDYIGTGPVFATATKADAKTVLGPAGMGEIAQAAPVPLVAIGGIKHTNAGDCFEHGAAGVAVISSITRADHPQQAALMIGRQCACTPRKHLESSWNDEFSLIKKLSEYAPSDFNHPMLLGDDAALLHQIQRPVITTDVQREGVHFRSDWQTPAQIGFKAVTVTLSDLAASYAAPVALFINLTLPNTITDNTAEVLYSGVHQALTHYGCALGGGNISTGSELALDLFAIGRGNPELFPMRNAARAGDGLYCTGQLGLAGAGLKALQKKDNAFAGLIAKFKSPLARFDAAEVLARHNVRCVMDISDGLAGDAAHIAEASGVSIVFDDLSTKANPELTAFCRKYDYRPEKMIFSGGEDYELLFACPPAVFAQIKSALPAAFQAGRCIEYDQKLLKNLPDGVASWQHGKLSS
ncbi:thiamine-phosphate kinase [Desulfococcaceae bacterium HSG9]|nr:thiamine-phosphate kinase [Desulfococcaceae bacterium HSG9]